MRPLPLSHEHALKIAAYVLTPAEIQRYPVKKMNSKRLQQAALEMDVPLAHKR